MPGTPLKEAILNIATGLMTLIALTVGGIRIKEYVDAKNNDPLKPVKLESWAEYQVGGHRIGPSPAKVTVVEFADFQCPFCAAAARDLSALRKQYPQLATIYRHFPLPNHPHAEPAAVASVCADRAGRFEAFHDLLFASKDSIGKRSWSNFARDANVSDIAAFEKCLTDSTALALVMTDRQAGEKLQIDGTPALLINNLAIRGYPGRAMLESHIKNALK